MFNRLLEFLNPLHSAETVNKRYFNGFQVKLVRLKGQMRVVLMLHQQGDTSGPNLDGTPVILPIETLDGLIAFLQECRDIAASSGSGSSS